MNNEIYFEIINNDSLIELKKLKDNSIDCVITDPPYFLHKLDNDWSDQNIEDELKYKLNSHIKHLPKGMKFDKKQVQNLYNFYLEISKIIFKKLKPGGYFLSFSSPRLYHAIAMSCEIAGFDIRDMINWIYTLNMPKGMSISHLIDKLKISDEEKEELKEEYSDFKTPQLKSCFEPICVAMKPFKGTFLNNELNFKTGLIDFSNKVGIDDNKVPANIITTEKINDLYDKNFFIQKKRRKSKNLNNISNTGNESNESNEIKHITQKPVELIEHLIRIFSKEGALILDPFLGSGTTVIACKNTNRNCIGIEISKKYYELSLKNLDK